MVSPRPDSPRGAAALTPLRKLLLTLAACAATTAVATPLIDHLDLANIVMLFLLTVLLVAVKLGRRAAVLASVLSVLLFDLFFVPPRFSLAVSNIQYLVTFAVMLLTALVSTHLTSDLRQKALEAQTRERRSLGLYEAARQLAGTIGREQVEGIAQHFVSEHLGAPCGLLYPDDTGEGLDFSSAGIAFKLEPHHALAAFRQGLPVYGKAVAAMGEAPLYLPLRASMRIRGVLVIGASEATTAPAADTVSLLEALASLVAVALERLHYVEVASAAQMRMHSEQLRSSILSALSHDLRTPLTALVGLAESLSLVKPPLPEQALETAQALHEQASRLSGMVANLLDLARLNAGQVRLRKEWQPLEEVVGASILLLGAALARHPVKVNLAPGLPLLLFDAVLIERVLCNLLENAAKYAPVQTPILLSAQRLDDRVQICVTDQGPGFAQQDRDQLFEMFVRGDDGAGKPGSGLGLAICKAIVQAHGGCIEADNRPEGGAVVRFTLPMGEPPVIEEELP